MAYLIFVQAHHTPIIRSCKRSSVLQAQHAGTAPLTRLYIDQVRAQATHTPLTKSPPCALQGAYVGTINTNYNGTYLYSKPAAIHTMKKQLDKQ